METEKKKISLLKSLKEGEVLHSSVTDTYYKAHKGKLYKYPAYAGADMGWAESEYRGPKRACMKAVSAKEVRSLT